MAKEIVVDGVVYVPKEPPSGEIKIVVLERGFVYVGRYSEDGDKVTITGARALIRWGTSKHIAELVNGPLPNTKMGDRCTLTARVSQVVYCVEVDNDKWTTHAG